MSTSGRSRRDRSVIRNSYLREFHSIYGTIVAVLPQRHSPHKPRLT